jgi:Tubulin binding cofactor C
MIESLEGPILPHVPFADVYAWLDKNLGTNEVLYPEPSSPTPGKTGPIHAFSMFDKEDLESPPASNIKAAPDQSAKQAPVRIIFSASSLSKLAPTCLNGCATTYFHLVTVGPDRAMKKRRSKVSPTHAGGASSYSNIGGSGSDGYSSSGGAMLTGSEDSDSGQDVYSGKSKRASLPSRGSAESLSAMSLSDQGESDGDLRGESALPTKGHKDSMLIASDQDPDGVDNDEDDGDDDAEDMELTGGSVVMSSLRKASTSSTMFGSSSSGAYGRKELPGLSISNSDHATLYMLGPYGSASITGCSDCEIIIGAVAGAIVVTGCERVRVSAMCRKLTVHNSLECEFNVATLTPSIISGDCRSLLVGKTQPQRNLVKFGKSPAIRLIQLY